MVVVSRASSQPTSKVRNAASHEDLGCRPACECGPSDSQRCIGRSRIDRLEALIIGDCFMVSSKADGITKARGEDVGLLYRSELPRGQCVELHVVQSIGRRIWSLVIHVGPEQAVAVGEPVVDTSSKEILVNHLLADERVGT